MVRRSKAKACRSFAAMEIEGPFAVPPIRDFHHAIPLLKPFGRKLVAKALASSIMACRKL